MVLNDYGKIAECQWYWSAEQYHMLFCMHYGHAKSYSWNYRN